MRGDTARVSKQTVKGNERSDGRNSAPAHRKKPRRPQALQIRSSAKLCQIRLAIFTQPSAGSSAVGGVGRQFGVRDTRTVWTPVLIIDSEFQLDPSPTTKRCTGPFVPRTSASNWTRGGRVSFDANFTWTRRLLWRNLPGAVERRGQK